MTHLILVGTLALVFLIATLRPINMGLLALAAAFLVSATLIDIPAKEVLAGFPGDLVVILVGVTFLFAIAERNGAIEWVVHGLTRMFGHRAVAMPWVVFIAAALLTSFGALGPAAVAIVAPVALRFAAQHKISPLMMGLMTIHGAQAGAFSPTSVYGGITNGVIEMNGVAPEPLMLFFASLFFNLAVAILIFLFLGGLRLLREAPDKAQVPEAPPPEIERERSLTLLTLGAMAIATIAFGIDIGVASMVAAAFLAIVAPRSQKGAVDRVAWSTVLLIAGVVTYVALLQRVGTVSAAGELIAGIGSPLLAVLLLCYLGGIVSAFASSTALLGIVVPLAIPFFDHGEVSAIGTVAAIAIATTIVDTSPFSTNGALVVANAAEPIRERLVRQLLGYSAIVALLGPLVAWFIFVFLA
ncbi:di/tricarboxylate transporter [Sphingopyxis panaciterrae]|uniref:SLC13 family permease n=1 Tax=Sphingopyxis panaciterrae TaxID=363841 RepID=UPI00141F63C8|nr:SLC13 family permease [Sphingopyxis panaciterrae]NIJ35833.1 di/tricarboxylate transporter [Sphingopyxis panaciterrae]